MMLPGAWQSLWWFLAILVMIPVALWLLKRSPLGGGLSGGMGTAHSSAPRMVAVLPLSAQHKLVTVEVGSGETRQWLVLGMSPQGLSTLHTLKADTEPPSSAAAPPAAAFNLLFKRMRDAGSANASR